MANAINVIHPYKYGSSWVFDDESRGLDKEAFVSGADSVIEMAVSRLGVVDPEHGFKLVFSGGPFPGYNLKAEWMRQDEFGAGNWYRVEQLGLEGWLCPALLKFFDAAPKEIYACLESRTGR